MAQMPKDELRTVASKPVFKEYKVGRSFGNPRGRERSGSFDQQFTTFAGEKLVGSATINHHANNPRFTPPLEDPSEASYRTPGVPSTHLFGIKNFTQYESEQVKGVGSALMDAVEARAREVGSKKVAMLPSSETIRRPRKGYDPQTMEMINADPNIHDKEQYYETFKNDPTGFYRHKGYQEDPTERGLQEVAFATVFDDPTELRKQAVAKTSHLSKPME
jgi:GNAT superfamily N-acetyltransferase